MGQCRCVWSFLTSALFGNVLLPPSLDRRYDNPLARRKPLIPSPNSDTTFPIQTFGEVSWSTRRHFIADTILLHNPDIFIFQEVLHNQLQDLVYLLGDEYAYVGVGRNDGHTKGEAVPVFWRKDKLQLRNQENGGVGQFGWTHFWLSEQPDVVGSVGWDAVSYARKTINQSNNQTRDNLKWIVDSETKR